MLHQIELELQMVESVATNNWLEELVGLSNIGGWEGKVDVLGRPFIGVIFHLKHRPVLSTHRCCSTR